MLTLSAEMYQRLEIAAKVEGVTVDQFAEDILSYHLQDLDEWSELLSEDERATVFKSIAESRKSEAVVSSTAEMSQTLGENPEKGYKESRIYTVAEFEALPDDGKDYELVKGELIEIAGLSGVHGEVVSSINSYLRTFAKAHNLGRVFVNASCVINDECEPVLNISFVAMGRLPQDFYGPIPVVPDLVIEVINPQHTLGRINDKVELLLKNKVRLLWLVNFLDKYVLEYRPGSKIRLLNRSDELDGGDVIPGFKLKVSTIFEQ